MARVLLDKTLERNQIQRYLSYIGEYRQIKSRQHPRFKTVKDLFDTYGLHKQTFHVYYRRYMASGEDLSALLPQKRGPKIGHMTCYSAEIEKQVIAYRQQGFDRYAIWGLLQKEYNATNEYVPSASTIRRICERAGLSRLRPRMKELKRKIIKKKAGELGHMDCHYLPKDIIKGQKKQLYLVGVIDDCTRVAWVAVSESLKALDIMFVLFDLLMDMTTQLGVRFDAMLTDNGPELSSRNNKDVHPVERCFDYFGIKHRYTKPYRPQTNGKIERYWRTIKEELLEGEQFESLDALKEMLIGYNMFYNQHRPHSGIGGRTPASVVETDTAE